MLNRLARSRPLVTPLTLLALITACSDKENAPAPPLGPQFGQIAFETRVDLVTGVNRTVDLALADLNGDGRVDLAAADLDGTVQISLGTTGGTFELSETLTVVGTPLGLRAVDLELDGDVDLCTIGAEAGALTVIRNDGLGGLTVEAPIAIQPLPTDFVVGDYDADGIIDVVVAHLSRADLLLVRGKADGTFEAPQSLELPRGTRASGIALADLTEDGFADLVICDTDNERVIVEIGSAMGLGMNRVIQAVGVRPLAVSVGNLDSDSTPDVAVSNFDSETVEVLEWDGLGAFVSNGTRDVGGNPGHSAIGDLTGDGIDDLAVCVLNQSVVRVWPGTGSGLAPDALEWAATGFPYRPLIEDLNLDTFSDLILVPGDFDRISVLFGSARGLVGARGYDFDVIAPEAIATADLDRDGTPEVIASGSATHDLVVGRPIDDGGVLTFAEDGRFDVGTGVQRIRVETVFDGRDVLLTTATGPVVYRNRSRTGNLELERVPAMGTLGPTVVMGDVRAGNLGGGPSPDLIYTDYGDDKVYVLFDSTLNLQFAAPVATEVLGGPLGIAITDLEGDGKPEIAVTRNASAMVSIFRVAESGALELITELVTGSNPSNIEVGDCDGDGRRDLVVANSGSASITAFLHRGGTTFQSQTQATGELPTALVVADFDRDGDEDCAVGALTGAEFRIFLDNDRGGIGRILAFPGTWGTTSASYADLDGDDRPEFLFGTLVGERFHVVLNRSRRVGN